MSLSFRDRCASCGFDYGQADIGDGTVVPVMMVANLVVLGFAMWLYFALEWSWWAVAVVTVLVALLVVGWLTRAMKAWLFAQQVRHDAAPGRVTRR